MSKEKKNSGRGSGLKKEMRCSEKLQAVVKEKKVSRGQMMKAVWVYIKRKKLQKNKKDKREIHAEGSKLEAIIGSKPINMFKMVKKLNEHLS